MAELIYEAVVVNEDTGEVTTGLFSSEPKAQKWVSKFDPDNHTCTGTFHIIDDPDFMDATIH